MKNINTKHINPLSQKQSGRQHCFCILHIYIIIFIITVSSAEKYQMDSSSYQAVTSASLISKTVLTEGNLQDLNLHGHAHAMPSDKITLSCSRMRAQLHAASQGMMCKTPFRNIFLPFHPKGVKVFVARTSPHMWSSPKTIYTTLVCMQTEVQSSLSSGADVGYWLTGRFLTRLEGPDWAPPPCLFFKSRTETKV